MRGVKGSPLVLAVGVTVVVVSLQLVLVLLPRDPAVIGVTVVVVPSQLVVLPLTDCWGVGVTVVVVSWQLLVLSVLPNPSTATVVLGEIETSGIAVRGGGAENATNEFSDSRVLLLLLAGVEATTKSVGVNTLVESDQMAVCGSSPPGGMSVNVWPVACTVDVAPWIVVTTVEPETAPSTPTANTVLRIVSVTVSVSYSVTATGTVDRKFRSLVDTDVDDEAMHAAVVTVSVETCVTKTVAALVLSVVSAVLG